MTINSVIPSNSDSKVSALSAYRRTTLTSQPHDTSMGLCHKYMTSKPRIS